MITPDCPGEPGFICLDGWKYTPVGGMIFSTNKRCAACRPPPTPDVVVNPEDDVETTG